MMAESRLDDAAVLGVVVRWRLLGLVLHILEPFECVPSAGEGRLREELGVSVVMVLVSCLKRACRLGLRRRLRTCCNGDCDGEARCLILL